MVTNPTELINISNNLFISKLEKIRRGFTKDNVGPMEILEYLIPRINNKAVFKHIDREGVKKLFKKINQLTL